RDQAAGQQLVAVAEHHRVRLGHNLKHVAALACRVAEALALADGEALDTVVLREYLTSAVDERAGRLQLWPPLAHQPRMIAVGYKADLDAVGLVRHRQTNLASDAPHLVLAQLADRE